MLSRAPLVAALVVAVLARVPAAAADELHQPQKLTVALSDELLGQLTPDGKRLYFVSNRNAVSEIFMQDLAAPASRLVFDEGADATWPRVSPDGRRLSYVSYADDANGRVCVRTLPDYRRDAGKDGGEAKLARRCFDTHGALEAESIDAGELLVLSRPSVDGDLQLARLRVDGVIAKPQPILARNLNSPSAGVAAPIAGTRWLAYVPLARAATRIGPTFAAQAARALAVRPLPDARAAGKAGGDAQEVSIQLSLSGGTTQPAFSPRRQVALLHAVPRRHRPERRARRRRSRRHLSRQGRRRGRSAVGAAAGRSRAADVGAVELPVSGAVDDAPHRHLRKGGSLDVYALPLDGMVPASWSVARLREERAASRDDWERLLLLHHILRAEPDPRVKAIVLLDVLRWHLVLGEYEAALFHARALARTGVPRLAEFGPLVEPLVAERRALRAFDRDPRLRLPRRRQEADRRRAGDVARGSGRRRAAPPRLVRAVRRPRRQDGGARRRDGADRERHALLRRAAQGGACRGGAAPARSP